MAFVQGFLASLSLDGNANIELVTVDVSFSESKTVLDKTVMDGSGRKASIPGMTTGTIDINGHIDQTNLNLLEASWAKDVPVAFVLTINEGLTTDGSWAGEVSLSAFDRNTSADGNWAFTLSGDTSGAVTYTPSSP